MSKYTVSYLGDLSTECVHEGSGARLRTDAPKDNRGKGEEFSPTDLLAVSLASCILTIMGIAAQGVGFDLRGARAEVEKEMAKESPRRVGRIGVKIFCPPCADLEMRKKIEGAGLNCPVHHSLHPEIRQEIQISWE